MVVAAWASVLVAGWMDMGVGARVPLQMARPFQRRPVARRQSLPLNQPNRWVRSLAASCGTTDVTRKS